MKIALFSETYLPYINGVATHVHMLKEVFTELGHEVLVVTVASEKQEEIKIEDGVVYVPGIYLKKIYGYRVAPPVGLNRQKIVKKWRPDVIHIHNEFGIADSGIRLAKKENIPVVYTLHSEYDEFLFYVGLDYFEDISKKLALKYFKHFSEAADIIISPSAKAQSYIDRQNVDKKVIVVENAVDFDQFRPTPEKIEFRKKFRKDHKLADDTKAFVYVGRIGEEKNLLELIEAFDYANKDPNKAVLFIIGKGPQEEEILDYIKELGAEDRIVFLGPVENSQVAKYLYAMDYYTTASLSEMHSISLLEAMATGLPAIIKLDPPNASQIIKGVNGYQWEDKEDFKDLFDMLMSLSPEEEDKLRKNVLDYSRKNDKYRLAKDLLSIYQKAIDMKKASKDQ